MHVNPIAIIAVILSAPAVLAGEPGKCFFGGHFGTGSCHTLDFNGKITDAFISCNVSQNPDKNQHSTYTP